MVFQQSNFISQIKSINIYKKKKRRKKQNTNHVITSNFDYKKSTIRLKKEKKAKSESLNRQNL